MSKVDGLRAIREARHAAIQAARSSAGTVGATATPPAVRPASPKPAGTAASTDDAAVPAAARPRTAKKPARATTADDAAVPAESDTDAECGHRSMNGRSCRRPAGHAQKSHRYN